MKLSAIWQVEGRNSGDNLHPAHRRRWGRRELLHSRREGGKTEPAEIQTAAKTTDGRARIPGSALKGVVRGGFPEKDPRVDWIFGLQEQDKAELLTVSRRVRQQAETDRAGADGHRRRLRRSAGPFSVSTRGGSLRHEIRGAGSGSGRAFADESWKDAAELILAGFERFNAETVRLGAGESNGWGLCRWTPGAVRVMEPADLRTWMQDPEPLDTVLGRARDRMLELDSTPQTTQSHGKTITLRLRFDGHPFLVNDPSKTGKKDDRKNAHAARRTLDGRLLLPAESFRGVLAHQAARIARTRKKGGDRQTVSRNGAGDLPRQGDPLTRLFGAAGWASPLEVRDFVEVSPPGTKAPSEPMVQEFLAIDRFTGGGAEERKFDAEGGWQPCLAGTLRVDLERLAKLGDIEPVLGLLALTLRDLSEGDLAFGWGSGKGYGWATVDTGGLDPVRWVERQLDGWAEKGTAVDWIRAWEAEGGNNG